MGGGAALGGGGERGRKNGVRFEVGRVWGEGRFGGRSGEVLGFDEFLVGLSHDFEVVNFASDIDIVEDGVGNREVLLDADAGDQFFCDRQALPHSLFD